MNIIIHIIEPSKGRLLLLRQLHILTLVYRKMIKILNLKYKNVFAKSNTPN